MSFILDALKKAESERSRNSGPVLMDVRVAPPRRRLPAWAWVLGVVLLANLGVLAWLLLREPAAPSAPAGAVSAPSPVAPVGAAPAAAVQPAPAPAPASPSPAVAELALPPPPPPATLDNLPTPQDLAAVGIALPALQLNLHVYDPSPALRYVLLNGARLGEGEYTADGIKVEAITPQGVVLEASGRRFRLPAGG
jgi:general secretion pathway protein B